jgi:aminoglycoside phosphotransferase (APT) family kinase protein
MDASAPRLIAELAADDLHAAALAFFPAATAIQPVAGHPAVARVETPAGPMRVRRWPPAVAPRDVALAHRVIAAARAGGVTVAPEIVNLPGSRESVYRRDGTLFDAQVWLPGKPPSGAETRWPEPGDRIELPVALPHGSFAEVVHALATLHASTAALAGEPDLPAAPLGMLPGAVRQAHARHYEALRARAPREPAIQRWLATSERLLAAAGPLVLAAAPDARLPVTVLHLGLWPSHVLLADGALAGLLGWERVAVGSPLLNLAQAILRLHGWTHDSVEAAIGAYSDTRSLAPEERRLLPAVAALDAVATTGRLLEQAFVPGITERPPTALRAAIDMLLRSLAAIDRDLSAPRSKHRQWRPARPAGQPRIPAKGARPRERRRKP